MLCHLSKVNFKASGTTQPPPLASSTRSVGDERHHLFDCPKFDDIRAQDADLYQSSAGAMRSFVWHKGQYAACDCMTVVIRLAET